MTWNRIAHTALVAAAVALGAAAWPYLVALGHEAGLSAALTPNGLPSLLRDVIVTAL